MKPAWAVVSTMDEPAPLVAAFAAHYLSIGASEVHIFLDQPDPEAEALLAGLPRVYLTVCDAAYWKVNKPRKRPECISAANAATRKRSMRRPRPIGCYIAMPMNMSKTARRLWQL